MVSNTGQCRYKPVQLPRCQRCTTHLECFHRNFLHVAAVLLRHRTRKREGLQVPADANPHRELWEPERSDIEHAACRQPLYAFKGPVVDVFRVLRDLVVFGQHLREERLETVVVLRLVRDNTRTRAQPK